MDRHLLKLTPGARATAHAWLDRALGLWKAGEPWMMELREAARSDDQNSALWGLLDQIVKQRPTHNGVKMNRELWKCVFMQALGAEIVFLPTLDGDGMFPAGHRSSRLTKREFSDLLEFILCWAAKEGLTIHHFDSSQEPEARQQRPPVAA